MKMINKKTLASTAAVSAIALSAMAPVANAEVEVSASVGAANMYYWRGLDLGGGAAISGDLSVSAGGAYGGIWTSSGDGSLGTEYDLYLGYGQEFGNFNFDVSLWTYAYPESEVGPGDLVELVAGFGFGPVSVTYYHGLEDLEDYSHVTIDAAFGSFNIQVGQHMDNEGFESIDGLTYVNLSYAYNDNLSFTLGAVVDDAETSWTEGDVTYVNAFNSEPKFIVSLSLPIEF
ncbi:MAG TPA: TorF family putative porin [Cellvibrionaceae bacterium]